MLRLVHIGALHKNCTTMWLFWASASNHSKAFHCIGGNHGKLQCPKSGGRASPYWEFGPKKATACRKFGGQLGIQADSLWPPLARWLGCLVPSFRRQPTAAKPCEGIVCHSGPESQWQHWWPNENHTGPSEFWLATELLDQRRLGGIGPSQHLAGHWPASQQVPKPRNSQCQGIHQESCHWFGGLVASPKDWQDSILHLHLPNGAAFSQMHSKWGSQKPGCAIPLCFQKTPKDLPPNVLKAIYGENMPEARYCQGLANLVQHHIPVRSTSKLLVGAQGINKPSKVEPQVQKYQSAETTVGPQDQLPQEMKTMNAHVAKMVEATAMAQVQAVPSQALPLPAPIQQATPQKAPLPLPAPHANDLLPLQGKPQNEAKTLEEYENQAMEQLAKAQKPKGKVEETEAQPKKAKGKKPMTKAGAKKAPGKPGVKPKASAKATASKASTLAKSKPGPKATPANRKLLQWHQRMHSLQGGHQRMRQFGIFADFGGLRLPGRDAWKKWFQARQRAEGWNHPAKPVWWPWGCNHSFSCVVWKPEKHHDVWMLCLMMFEKRSCWVFGPAILEPSIGDICCEVTMKKNELSQCIFAYLLKIHWQPKHAIHAWPACNFAFLTIAFFYKSIQCFFFSQCSTQCFLEHPVLPWAPSASLSTQYFLGHPVLPFCFLWIIPGGHIWPKKNMGEWVQWWHRDGTTSWWWVLDTAWWHLRPSFFLGHQSIVAKFFFDLWLWRPC